MDTDQLRQDLINIFDLECIWCLQHQPDDGKGYPLIPSYTWAVVVAERLVVAGNAALHVYPEAPPYPHRIAAWMLPRQNEPIVDLKGVIPITLETNRDEVAIALRSMNILPAMHPHILGPDYYHGYEVFSWTMHGFSYARYDGSFAQSDNMTVFFNTVAETARIVAAHYQDDAMNKFLDYMVLL